MERGRRGKKVVSGSVLWGLFPNEQCPTSSLDIWHQLDIGHLIGHFLTGLPHRGTVKKWSNSWWNCVCNFFHLAGNKQQCSCWAVNLCQSVVRFCIHDVIHDVITVKKRFFCLFFVCPCRKTRIRVITWQQHTAGLYVLCAMYDVLWSRS